MRLPVLVLGFAVSALITASGASAQTESGAFGPMSPGNLGQGGGQYSDFQKLREEMVEKMRNGTYADIVRQGRANVEASQHVRRPQR